MASDDRISEQLSRIEHKIDLISPKVGVMETHVHNVEHVARCFSFVPWFGTVWKSRLTAARREPLLGG